MIAPIMTIAFLLGGITNVSGSSTTSKEKIDTNIDEWCRRERAKKELLTNIPLTNESRNIRDAIHANMKNGKLYTIINLIQITPECADITNQRVCALVRSMINDGLIERIEKNKKVLFIKI